MAEIAAAKSYPFSFDADGSARIVGWTAMVDEVLVGIIHGWLHD